MVAYLIVSHSSINFGDACSNVNPFQKNYGRVKLLQNVQKSVKYALEKCSPWHFLELQPLGQMATNIL